MVSVNYAFCTPVVRIRDKVNKEKEMLSNVFAGLCIMSGLCGIIYQIKAAGTQDWKKQSIATFAWTTATVFMCIAKLLA